MKIIICIGIAIVVLDLFCTFLGKPLIGPGPFAKLMYPGLDNKEKK